MLLKCVLRDNTIYTNTHIVNNGNNILCAYYDISSLAELQPRLENDHVDDVDEVS